ncbi:ATP-binding cassette domain-containing protein [Saccharopolyspora terrae]|uniref:ATP-binding cassette domain-containing protein n=1 Tax=Saccharopolyspora terrae TaxID=2530384 RepID=UPI00267E4243
MAVGAQLRRLHDLRGARSVEQACAAASYPADVQHLLPGQHSSGQVQRAALAAALLSAPRLLVVDEPTASLDTATAHAVWGSLRRYADTGAAVLAITHDVSDLVDLGVVDRMLFTAASERRDPLTRGALSKTPTCRAYSW